MCHAPDREHGCCTPTVRHGYDERVRQPIQHVPERLERRTATEPAAGEVVVSAWHAVMRLGDRRTIAQRDNRRSSTLSRLTVSTWVIPISSVSLW